MQPLSEGKVTEGIRLARAYAAEKGVPLQVERVAACIGVDVEILREYVAGDSRLQTLAQKRAARLLRQVWLECKAEIAEELLTKTSSTGRVLLAKHHFGYAEKGEESVLAEPVIFRNEEELPP